MSVEAPERIWVERDPDTGEKRWFSIKGMGDTEYVRADKLEELAAENERLNSDSLKVGDQMLAEKFRADKAEPAPAARSGAVKVKPLEWVRGWMNAEAQTDIGLYQIAYRRDGSFEWCFDIKKEWASSWDAAKAAAQADYERRILAALEPAEPAVMCVGCEGKPSPENSPCAVCGKQAAEPATDAEPVEWRTAQKKFYHSEWGTSKLLEARDGGLVTDEGEAWFYEHTSKDGTGGSYDMLFSRVYSRPPESQLREAAKNIIDRMFSTYKARNGREVGIEADDGEKCWIVHSDDIEGLRAALAQEDGR